MERGRRHGSSRRGCVARSTTDGVTSTQATLQKAEREGNLAGRFLARWLFLRLLALIFAIAFASLWVQIDGLIGSRGILPIADYVEHARRVLGSTDVARLPTLCWWSASDTTLHAHCAAGVALSAALFFGFAPRACLVCLWVLYLSLTTAGQEFLSFQWDVLLLETAFFAIFYAPGGLRPGLTRERPPAIAALWLVRWLLVRLIFASGAVKLASGDTTWRDLTALTYHDQTQPLPTPLAWYAHQLPIDAQRVCCALMFAVELVLPWFAFGPRRMRIAAGLVLIAFQVVIMLTGNYGFFNWLAIALCLPLFDDAFLARWLPARLTSRVPAPVERERSSPWRRVLVVVLASFVAVFTALMLVKRLVRDFELPRSIEYAAAAVAPLRSLNTYGLFAVMTTARYEIRIEGSLDGLEWREYVFRYKPGDVGRAPGWVAPHMPRLDWQMWFAALGRSRDNPWVVRLLERLREGSPDVALLFASNPFPGAPPPRVRATLWDYRFTTFAERKETANAWTARRLGLYAEALAAPGRR